MNQNLSSNHEYYVKAKRINLLELWKEIIYYDDLYVPIHIPARQGKTLFTEKNDLLSNDKRLSCSVRSCTIEESLIINLIHGSVKTKPQNNIYRWLCHIISFTWRIVYTYRMFINLWHRWIMFNIQQQQQKIHNLSMRVI